MKRSFLYLAASLLVGGAVAACSAGVEGDLTGEDGTEKPGKKPAPTQPGGGDQPSTPETPAETPSGEQPKPPAEGPGSATAAGRLLFDKEVYPKVSGACGACHATGAAGAPKFMGADAAASYVGLDGYGLIVPNSRFLLKGKHANDTAPALTTDQAAVVTKWLEQEAKDRAGTPAAVNTFEVLSKCIEADPAAYQPVAQALETLQTQPRQGENQNQCTGCRQARCSSCHNNNVQGFLAVDIGVTSVTTKVVQTAKLDKDPANIYFPHSLAKSHVGLNGTELVVATKLKAKADAVKTGVPYSHPMFNVPANVQTAVDTYAQTLITKFKNKQCGQ